MNSRIDRPGPDRPRRSRRRQRGMTLLEIMIVLAILALVIGLVLVPKVYERLSESREETQRILVKKYAHEGFIEWVRKPANQAKGGCPASLQEIADILGRKDTNDNWGTPLSFYCGSNLPPGAQSAGFAVQSAGPDRQMNTPDDIKSWD
jgi:general secretion pathway protein G